MHGEHVNGPGLRFEVIDVPGHTSGPIADFAAPVGDTRACCAHEHTLSNLKFARAMEPAKREPANREPAAHTAWCESRRAAGVPTLPSSIARELQANPFLHCAERAPAQRARDRGAPTHDAVAVAVPAALREWKNE